MDTGSEVHNRSKEVIINEWLSETTDTVMKYVVVEKIDGNISRSQYILLLNTLFSKPPLFKYSCGNVAVLRGIPMALSRYEKKGLAISFTIIVLVATFFPMLVL